MKEFKNIFGHYSSVTLYGSAGEVRYKYINDDIRCMEANFDTNGDLEQQREIKK